MDNPWAFSTFNVTNQGRYVARYGLSAGERLAKLAGTTIGGPPFDPRVKEVKVYIIHGRKGDKGDKGEAGEPGAVIPLVIDEG